ncbi:metallophosphoesterase [Tumebacillus sp. ITR2]|uniref:Phosphoesterase n=1 Tax=Tumebacillus amylolyticus TaxID=2801339 RepID=A0ABS1JA39_9BACL|nr:metallophosphoesterase [Tumebacillus amylolyticus]MBL0387141.1 metallophosphoesterase [Tumebacillus amylolyticus]
MRVLIISDSHGRTDRIQLVVRQVGRFDLLVHAGDHADDVLDDFPRAIAVCGNCDDPASAATEQEFELLGLKVLLAHGHTLNVKTTPLPLLYRAAERQADIAVFGHTHTPTLTEEEGRVFLNPGSLSYPRGYTVCTYCVLDLTRTEQGGVEADFAFYTLDGDRIPAFDLKKTWEAR